MAVSCTGSIQYTKATKLNDKAEVEVQGMVKLAKGTFDWMGIVAWQTSWRFFDPYGKLLLRDDRSHSIMPFASQDEATDKFSVKLPYSSYYQIQLYGPCVGVLDTSIVSVGAIPTPKPAPEPPPSAIPEPEPEPPLPEPPTPTPKPTPKPAPAPTPTPTPTPGLPKLPIDWTWIAVGGIVLLALTMTGKKGKRQ